MRKQLFTLFLILTTVFTIVGCSSKSNGENDTASNDGEEVYKIKLGHTGAPDHHYQMISEQFAELVEERTDGNVQISIFPSDQLGDQNTSVEGVMAGTLDIVLTSDTVLSNWVPDLGVLNLPFLFNDSEHVRNVLDGEIGDALGSKVEEHGAVVIGWWENGFRHITNSKQEILSPDDLQGLKIRTPEGEVFIESFKALGASPTPISFGELYSALQLGTVDAQENPPAHVLTQKFYEVQDYISKTDHIHISSPLLMNKELLESLPTEYQDVIKETALELAQEHTDLVLELEDEQWKEIEENGMVVTEVDKQPFIDAVKPVYEKYENELDGEIIQGILDLK